MSGKNLSRVRLNRIYKDAIIFSLIAIFLIEVFYYFKGVPIRENVVDWFIGAAVAVTLISYAFRRVSSVYSELERVKENLEFEHQQLISIFDSINEPIYVADIETYELLYANKALKEKFGEDIIGKLCYEVLQTDQSSPCSFCTNDRICKGSAIQPPYIYESQNAIDSRWYRCIDKAIKWPGGRVVRFELAIDITAYKEAEKALRLSEEKYRKLVERANDGIVIIQDGVLKFANSKFMEEYSLELDAAIGKDFREFVAPEFLETLIERYHKRMAGEPVPDIYEARLIDGDGMVVDTEINASLIEYEGGKADLVIVRDITERKRAEEKLLSYQNQLRCLASELALAEERERRRIATELHDRITQTLATCKLKVGSLLESPSSVDSGESLEKIYDLIDQVFKDTRSLMFDLSPPVLYELSFESAMAWLAEQVRERNDIPVDFESDKQLKPLSEDIKVVLFQAVRELLTNIVKHSQASNAKVSVRRDDDSIQIKVEDNGIGFDVSEAVFRMDKAGGFGLFNIRERLSHLGGGIEIESGHGQGTEVTLVAPLDLDRKQLGGKRNEYKGTFSR